MVMGSLLIEEEGMAFGMCQEKGHEGFDGFLERERERVWV